MTRTQTVQPTRPTSAQRGFTLVELMIVITLLAVVAGIAVPSFRGMVADNRIAASTNSVVSALNYARSEALREGRRVEVSPRSESDWSRGVSVTQGNNILRVTEAFNGQLQVTGDSVSFRGNGLANESGVIRLCSNDGSRGREVRVTLGGRINTTEVVCE